MCVVLGVDAGNSKTVALVARLDGSIVGAGRGGCGDIYAVFGGLSAREAEAVALANIRSAAANALSQAGVGPSDLLAGAFSMAGADWPEDIDFLHDAMVGMGLGDRVVVVNDALGGLRAGSTDGTGVAVVCGTGVAIGARAASGRVWHSSFWPERLGGYHMGAAALRAVYRSELGIDPPTTLTARILDLLGHRRVEDVLHAQTARLAPERIDLSRITALLLDEAAAGDAVAGHVVREDGIRLGDYALAAARRVGLDGAQFTLVMAGGVFRHPSRMLADAMIERVRSTCPHARPVQSSFEPVVGALLLALELAGTPIDDETLSRIARTLPAGRIFATLDPGMSGRKAVESSEGGLVG